MNEFVIVLLIGSVITLAILFGRSRAQASSDAAVDKAEAGAQVAITTARLEREARDRASAAAAVAGEINDAAPASLSPDARLDALDEWVRTNADRLSAGGGSAAAVRRRAPTDPGRKAKP